MITDFKLYESFIGRRIKFAEEAYKQIIDVFEDPQKIKDLHNNKKVPILINIEGQNMTFDFSWFQFGEHPMSSRAFFNRDGNIVSINMNSQKFINELIPFISIPVLSMFVSLILGTDIKHTIDIGLATAIAPCLSYILSTLNNTNSMIGRLMEKFYLKFPFYFKKTFRNYIQNNKDAILHEFVHLYDHLTGTKDYSVIYGLSKKDAENKYIAVDMVKNNAKHIKYVNQGTERNAFFITTFIDFLSEHKIEEFENAKELTESFFEYINGIDGHWLKFLGEQNRNFCARFLEEYFEELSTNTNQEWDFDFVDVKTSIEENEND